MGRVAQLRDDLGCPLWVHIEPHPSEAGWYEVRSGHWELLLWVTTEGYLGRDRLLSHLENWRSLEGPESAVPVTDHHPVRFRRLTVWEHLCRTT